MAPRGSPKACSFSVVRARCRAGARRSIFIPPGSTPSVRQPRSMQAFIVAWIFSSPASISSDRPPRVLVGEDDLGDALTGGAGDLEQFVAGGERVLDRDRVLDQLVVLGGRVADHEPAADGVELLDVDLGAAGVEDGEPHPVGVVRELFVGLEDDVAIGRRIRWCGVRRAAARRIRRRPGRAAPDDRVRWSRAPRRGGPRSPPGRCGGRCRWRRGSRRARIGPAASRSKRPWLSSLTRRNLAARMGPTVCEEDGPIPILKMSKTLSSMNGA